MSAAAARAIASPAPPSTPAVKNRIPRYKCRHPRTPENSVTKHTSGGAIDACATCAAMNTAIEESRRDALDVISVAALIDLRSGFEPVRTRSELLRTARDRQAEKARAVYRREKRGHDRRTAELLAEAKAEFDEWETEMAGKTMKAQRDRVVLAREGAAPRTVEVPRG